MQVDTSRSTYKFDKYFTVRPLHHRLTPDALCRYCTTKVRSVVCVSVVEPEVALADTVRVYVPA